MAWLYMPPEALRGTETIACSGSRSAPAPAGSTSGSCSPVPDIALWVTSSGKPSPRPCSWRGWKTRPWIARLSGTTLPPSTAARGAARVDILSAGYPCQPFSVAGRRLGAADPRHLWPHVARIVGEVEPPFVFLENVAHHLRLGFPEVAGDLVGLGYRLAAGLFTAAEVGAPHRRERLFILAHREGDADADPARLLADADGGRQQGHAEPDERPDRTPRAHHDGMTLCDAMRLWLTPTRRTASGMPRDGDHGATRTAGQVTSGWRTGSACG